MKLREALLNQNNMNPEIVDEILNNMIEDVENGENPENVLYEQGLEPDYVLELIEMCN